MNMKFRRYRVFTEIDLRDHEHLRYIQVDIGGKRDRCYRSIMSYNAFVHGDKERNQKRKELLYYGTTMDDFIRRCRFDVSFFEQHNIMPPHLNVPIEQASSLWEFYKMIGYDHKKNKWST